MIFNRFVIVSSLLAITASAVPFIAEDFPLSVVPLNELPAADTIPAPVNVSEPIKLLTRATEGIHLVNCEGNGYAYSIEIYCSDDSNCNYQPSSNNQCFLSSSGLFTWEGRSNQGCGFTSGTTFYYTLPYNAQSYADFTKVGTGYNAYHNYNIFKDNKHVMYTAGNGAVCRSIYYCLQA
ncbi:hypothetical protein J7T55_014418 [Diaporthe amygdali]|uniref:uncharacterized protein n=1 Tax=Phomopsis amygdali TaxID=1214568 RepID=UPI0022FE887B|nr:uncharacterized protein J7T55_014418 [Diaporthe amygdali]KAJ0117967.1 hypothetical protein J7T55_014418 [Diaporthe amygdali]